MLYCVGPQFLIQNSCDKTFSDFSIFLFLFYEGHTLYRAFHNVLHDYMYL
jgi:hypothetical protein